MGRYVVLRVGGEVVWASPQDSNLGLLAVARRSAVELGDVAAVQLCQARSRRTAAHVCLCGRGRLVGCRPRPARHGYFEFLDQCNHRVHAWQVREFAYRYRPGQGVAGSGAALIDRRE